VNVARHGSKFDANSFLTRFSSLYLSIHIYTMATTTPANVFPTGIKPFAERKHPKVICMFDVDGTLTPARLQGSKTMLDSLKKLREYTATAFVGGSDFKKIEWQLEILNEKSKWILFESAMRGGQS